MDALVHCPNVQCGKAASVPAAYLGRRLRCPHCGQRFSTATPAPSSVVEAKTGHDLPGNAVAGATLAVQAAPSPGPVVMPQQVGRFTIRQRLGEGAFGVVYRAYDPQLEREVALKVAKPEMLSTESRVKRFLREAKAAANLRHPHIVPVFDSGRDGDRYYIASAFIPGRSLAGRLLDLPEGQTFDSKQTAQVVRLVAEALAYAHSRGVTHRDVKPANIMLDERGEPLLVDFGLAAREEGAERLTQEGVHALGTPAYMAPEQAAGKAQSASDQYSLGCTLYELLTGQTPFAGPPELQIFLHQTQEARGLRSLNRKVARDLETICMKAQAKEPQGRYRTCQEMADDLQRWLEGEPIRARQVGRLERTWRWGRRNPLSAALIGAVWAALALGTAIAWTFAVQAQANATRASQKERLARSNEERATANEQKAKASEERAKKQQELAKTNEKTALKALGDEKVAKQKADAELLRAEWLLYASRISLAQREWEANNLFVARRHLDACRPDFRGWEHDYLHTLFTSNQRTLRGHKAHIIFSVTFSPDGKRLASAGQDQMVRVWDAETGKETLKVHAGNVSSVTFSPNGKRLASSGWDTAKLWDAETGQEMLTLKGLAGSAIRVAFSPDGKRLATGAGDVTFSPDGKRLVTGAGDAVKVWDVKTAKEMLTLKGPILGPGSVALIPDGQRRGGGEIIAANVWDLQTGRNTLNLKGLAHAVRCLAFSPDGKRLAGGGPERTIKIWDAATGQDLLTLRGHTGSVNTLAYSPDGRHLVSGSQDQTLKVWDAATGQEVLILKGHTWPIRSVAFSPDGKRLVTGSHDSTLKLWDATTAQGELTLKAGGPVVFSRDGKRLASASTVWDATTGQEMLTLKGQGPVAFSPDGKHLASAGWDTTHGLDAIITLWNVQTGAATFTLRGHTNRVHAVAFSPDGNRLASASDDKTAKIWDARTGQNVLTLTGHTQHVSSLAFSPDGSHLASASWDGTVKVWQATTGHIAFTLSHGHQLHGVAYSPDGKRLASASGDATVKLWDAQTGQEIRTLRGHTGTVWSVAWSPDGKRLASASGNINYSHGDVKIWDVDSGQDVLTLKGHTDQVSCVAFSPDGKRLVTSSWDSTVKIWDGTTKAPGELQAAP